MILYLIAENVEIFKNNTILVNRERFDRGVLSAYPYWCISLS
jgi:hypothetical protein